MDQVLSPPNTYVEALTSNVTYLEVMKVKWHHKGGALIL